MRIALYNVEPQIINTAMMQVSQYHKGCGDSVHLYNPLFHQYYDRVYAFSIFDYSDKGYVKPDMVRGGTGFNLSSKLDRDIERSSYDWSLYPDCDYSILWFSRGCIRKCPYCVVWKKEGDISSVEPKNLNPNGEYIKVYDNNFFANPEWRSAIKKLRSYDQPVEFNSGIDVRLMDSEIAEAILSLKHRGQIHIAWDNPKEDMIPCLNRIIKYIKPYRLMCYVLIGYWSTPEQDLMRVEALRKLDIDPFVMPFDRKDSYQKNFARYVNMKAIFNSVSWQDYDPLKSF